MWQCDWSLLILNPRVLKIAEWKINWKENKIRKKIKKKLSPHSSILTSKLYVQASKQFNVQTSKLANNTMKVIKIKDIFPTSNTQKVNQIHKIISSSFKPKLHIQMTTKSPSRKQVIILMSSDNISKFMKNSLLYVASINWLLRNTKSEVLVDFIQSDVSSVTVITNKVAVQSDLYIIKSYIKKIDNINTININTSFTSIKVLFKNYRCSLLSS